MRTVKILLFTILLTLSAGFAQDVNVCDGGMRCVNMCGQDLSCTNCHVATNGQCQPGNMCQGWMPGACGPLAQFQQLSPEAKSKRAAAPSYNLQNAYTKEGLEAGTVLALLRSLLPGLKPNLQESHILMGVEPAKVIRIPARVTVKERAEIIDAAMASTLYGSSRK